MKKLILLPVLLYSAVVIAQIQLGVKAGVNISNFTGGDFDVIENKALVAFHGGGLVRFKLGKLVLQPEVLFSTQGAKLENAGNKEDYKVSYINIPVMLQYETDGGFYVEAGPQVGFKVSEDLPDNTIEDFAKSSDVAIGFGLGYHSKMGLGIGARYNVGLSKVGDFDSNNSNNIDPDFKNGVLMISLFFTFFGKEKE